MVYYKDVFHQYKVKVLYLKILTTTADISLKVDILFIPLYKEHFGQTYVCLYEKKSNKSKSNKLRVKICTP